jgi:hypothetical protein
VREGGRQRHGKIRQRKEIAANEDILLKPKNSKQRLFYLKTY